MARGRTINTYFILEFSAYKINILRPRPLITGTHGVIKSQSGKVYCWFPSLDDTYQHWISMLPINLMLIKVRFLCTCTVMDDAKSLTCIKSENDLEFLIPLECYHQFFLAYSHIHCCRSGMLGGNGLESNIV